MSKTNINSWFYNQQVRNYNLQLLKEEGFSFRRGSVGVRYGRPATLLDAANYAKEEWDKLVTDEIIKIAFIKSDLRISLESAFTETFDNKKLLKVFKNFNITATRWDINEFDEENSHLFEEANCFLKNNKQ